MRSGTFAEARAAVTTHVRRIRKHVPGLLADGRVEVIECESLHRQWW